MSTIKYWIDNDVEAADSEEEMPKPHYRPMSYIKTALLWSFYYLMKNESFENAMLDIIKRGGDTRCNAAVVGGLIGAANGLGDCKQEIEGIQEILANVNSIV